MKFGNDITEEDLALLEALEVHDTYLQNQGVQNPEERDQIMYLGWLLSLCEDTSANPH